MPSSRSTTSPELGIEPGDFLVPQRRRQLRPDAVLPQRTDGQGHGLANVAITASAVMALLDRVVARSALTHPDGGPVKFTPHDFRRIFATEAVASGLPIHIAAKLLGHESLNTTQGYVAAYDGDVIEHHRAFIARRRSQRPSREYRDVTDDEWDEFLAHFEKRKVELGICGRAYATPCQHEHACLRCPLLRPDPAQFPRLAEAHDCGWAGEIDGLEISLVGAKPKHCALDRSTVPLGRWALC